MSNTVNYEEPSTSLLSSTEEVYLDLMVPPYASNKKWTMQTHVMEIKWQDIPWERTNIKLKSCVSELFSQKQNK